MKNLSILLIALLIVICPILGRADTTLISQQVINIGCVYAPPTSGNTTYTQILQSNTSVNVTCNNNIGNINLNPNQSASIQCLGNVAGNVSPTILTLGSTTVISCNPAGGGGSTPTGPAGGDLGGTYPNPTVTNGSHLGAGTVPLSALVGGGTLAGVVTGAPGSNVFNSTNTAGNEMDNALLLFNNNSSNSGVDLDITDTTQGGEYISLGHTGFGGPNLAGGWIESFFLNPGNETDFGTDQSTSSAAATGIECDSADVTAPNYNPGYCYTSGGIGFLVTGASGTRLGANNITNLAGTGPPIFTHGLQSNGVDILLSGSGVVHLVSSGVAGASTLTVPSNVTGAMSFLPTIYSAAGTVIPAAASGNAHIRACVSDSTLCTSGTTYVSGGSTPCEVWSNGTNWIESGSGC